MIDKYEVHLLEDEGKIRTRRRSHHDAQWSEYIYSVEEIRAILPRWREDLDSVGNHELAKAYEQYLNDAQAAVDLYDETRKRV